MFPSRKSRGPLISASCERPGLRLFLFCCLFSLIVSAYWWNFEQRLAKIQPPDGSHSVINEGELLEKPQLSFLYAWRNKFQKEWNIPLLMQISTEELLLPEYPSSSLYMGVGLKRGEAVIAVPPLVRKALGEGLRLETEEQLGLCIRSAPAIAAYVAHEYGEEKQALPLDEQPHISVQQEAAAAVTRCFDQALNHIWEAL